MEKKPVNEQTREVVDAMASIAVCATRPAEERIAAARVYLMAVELIPGLATNPSGGD